MYAHPSFVRGKPENLSELRKCNSASSRRRLAAEAEAALNGHHQTQVLTAIGKPHDIQSAPWEVSPSPSQVLHQHQSAFPTLVPFHQTATAYAPTQNGAPQQLMLAAPPQAATIPKQNTTGKLGLLTMAMTSIEERSGVFMSGQVQRVWIISGWGSTFKIDS